jgi:hypothetical protein
VECPHAPAFDFGGTPWYIDLCALTEGRGNLLKGNHFTAGLLECVVLLFAGETSLLHAQTTVRFAVVGDYGDTPPSTGYVATLVKSWNPDFIITTGDNNYTNPTPAPPNHYAAWDGAVGQYYHDFVKYPAGSGSAWAGSGSATIRFYPSVGNHDWDAGIAGWYSYFELPWNERYYDFVRGPVHLYAVDSDVREPDGNTSTSVQGVWLKGALDASTAAWNFVYFHHPAYSSAQHGSTADLQWPFASWRADAVLNGHDHVYERIMQGTFPYFVVGTGGRSLYAFTTPVAGSEVRYNANYGAMLVDATADSAVFRFYSISGGAGGTLIDRYVLYPSGQPTGIAGEPPPAIALFQNYPNPFNPRTAIRYSLSSSGPVRLTIYDPLGREIATLVNGSQTAGTHTVEWDGNAFAGGIYYCMLRAGSFVQTRPLILIK